MKWMDSEMLGPPLMAAPPRRVVSLVPSTTESVVALGAAHLLVGRTRFCCHPKVLLRRVPKVGGTKDVDVDAVLALEPDLVLANREENTQAAVEALAQHVPVWAPMPRTVDAAIDALRTLGVLLGQRATADAWCERAARARAALHTAIHDRPRERVAYLIWRKPWMVAGPDTFIGNLLAEAGLDVWVPGNDRRYPEVVVDHAPVDRLLLSSEPFRFRPRHQEELSTLTGLPHARVVGVDGAALSWHGIRLVEGLAWLRRARCESAWQALDASPTSSVG